ncbi:2-amino-3-carboxymuconate-6-semialdehyde decarboxylase [Pediococcus damnosus]|uniref:amidohydrolase family protein n=1 Tax=Pediococcus damnosus TaxID=51663 RepID=UPI00078D5BD4|nr:amidohydrolase family protein [Pediococcus damnosus]AMV69523.1 2-amino-3-carboxymuconate-6-semialdehyde decarboxylase [Pediococcus damnosus]
MKLITTEEHYNIPSVERELKAYKATQPQRAGNPEIGKALGGGLAQYNFPDEKFEDMDARLKFMDDHGITMQVLSAEGLETIPGNIALPIAKLANDETAKLVAKHPDRYAGFATIATQDPEGSAQKLERAVKELGMKGTMIHGRTLNKYLDDPFFEPIFAEAEKLDVPIYVHPGVPKPEIIKSQYLSDQYSPAAGGALATPGFGWHAEAGLQVVRMMLAGVLDRHPSLKLIMGHWGELTAFYQERLDETLMPVAKNLDRKISEYFQDNVYVTPSGLYTKSMMNWAIEQMGADHIMYATDYPFEPTDQIEPFIRDAKISETDREMIAHGTAEKLLKL